MVEAKPRIPIKRITPAQMDENEEVEITLYALTRTPTPGTMRTKGRINGSRLVILIDTGSTHNFVNASLVNSL